MKLDRNLPDNGKRGKYALLLMRKLDDLRTGTFGELPEGIRDALQVLIDEKLIDWGDAGTESEFFVIRLKDRFAREALFGYSHAALDVDPEWSEEVYRLGRRAGPSSRWCKDPD